MPILRLLVLLLAIPTAPALAADVHGHMTPIDEAPSNPEFLAFRTALMDAVARMDAGYILSVTPETLDTGSLIDEYGADLGRRALELGWMPEGLPKEQWDLWPALADILANGGRFVEPGKFCAPYFHTELPQALATDPDYRYGVVTGSAPLTVYRQPTVTAHQLGQVRPGDILQLLNPGGFEVPDSTGASAASFTAVWFADQPGYADADALRRLGGLYACFARDRILDKWLMVSFGAPRGRE